tara:strand:- start:312 stop:479 length:168 start_codon:yes stop_codon:yes gene_type:complete
LKYLYKYLGPCALVGFFIFNPPQTITQMIILLDEESVTAITFKGSIMQKLTPFNG